MVLVSLSPITNVFIPQVSKAPSNPVELLHDLMKPAAVPSQTNNGQKSKKKGRSKQTSDDADALCHALFVAPPPVHAEVTILSHIPPMSCNFLLRCPFHQGSVPQVGLPHQAGVIV